ncbi:MAG: cell wall hydrolase [Holosporales bacterium]
MQLAPGFSDYSEQDLEIMARTIYGEARGEYARAEGGLAALIGVANVILNRWHMGGYGQTLAEVCTKPYQFSCWNIRDPNRRLIEQVASSDAVFGVCAEVARYVVEGRWPDLTQGADHYHAKSMKQLPKWAVGVRPRAQLGGHVFYRLKTNA